MNEILIIHSNDKIMCWAKEIIIQTKEEEKKWIIFLHKLKRKEKTRKINDKIRFQPKMNWNRNRDKCKRDALKKKTIKI